MGKMVKTINFSHVCQNSGLSLKLNYTLQHKSKSMLSFQNGAPGIKILKFQANQETMLTLGKM